MQIKIARAMAKSAAILTLLTASMLQLEPVRADFPGERPSQPFPKDELAYLWIMNVPAVYYRVHGRYPDSWAEIEAAGLVQMPLFVQGQQVNPDDGRFDFPGDLAYLPQGPQRAPQVAMLTSSNGMTVHREQCNAGKMTYLQLFNKFERNGVPVPSSWRSIESRTRFGIAALLNQGFYQYFAYNKHGLTSLDALLDSGLVPFSRESVLPGTSERLFSADSSFGFILENTAANVQASEVIALVHPRGEDGKIYGGFSY